MRSDGGLAEIALVVCIVVATAASAQSVPAEFRVVVAAGAVEKQLLAGIHNLHQMSHELSSAERDCARNIVTDAQDFDGAFSEAVTVGRILTEMKSAQDQTTVRLYYFGQSARKVVTLGNLDLEAINACLVEIRAPAVLAEATKVRDAVAEARRILEPFASK